MKKLSISIIASLLSMNLHSHDASGVPAVRLGLALGAPGKTLPGLVCLKQKAANILKITDQTSIEIKESVHKAGKNLLALETVRHDLKTMRGENCKFASVLYGNHELSSRKRVLRIDLEIDHTLPKDKADALENLMNSYILKTLAPNFDYDSQKEIFYSTEKNDINNDFKSLRFIEKKDLSSGKETMRDFEEQKKDEEWLKQKAAEILQIDQSALKIEGLPNTKGNLNSPMCYFGIERVSPKKDIIKIEQRSQKAVLEFSRFALPNSTNGLSFNIKIAQGLSQNQQEKLENLLNAYVCKELAPALHIDFRYIWPEGQEKVAELD